MDHCLRKALPQVLLACQLEPGSMLRLAHSLHCEWIFKEAAAHLVGLGNIAYERQRIKMNEKGPLTNLETMLTTKYISFCTKLKDIDFDLLKAAPMEEDDIWEVLLTSHFRMWFTSELVEGYGSSLDRSKYASVYRQIEENDWYKHGRWNNFVESLPGFTEYPYDLDPLLFTRRLADILKSILMVYSTQYRTEHSGMVVLC
ncbi:hypothetical protein BU16DRAFT_558909 [Lophium mytilinum]|uniref:Uncharacterized protein n=1 Tax=Lophium mytilinum TaxID=390894 RepID=A0A6A6R2D9_9PEZI|nr:hypothetical protein BU16DRAFT_558909 [Lophium mytilinum]